MEDERPMLLYYKMRGSGQLIRAILVEIGVDYLEVYMNEPGIAQDLQQCYQIEVMSLPYLICEGQAVCGIFNILKYCCNKYGRKDLLGSTIPEQVKISEIGIKYVAEINKCIKDMFTSLQSIRRQPSRKSQLSDMFNRIVKFMKSTKYFSSLKQLFLKSNGYLFGHLTILDIIFYESCFFIQNFLGTQDQQLVKHYLEFFRTTPLHKKCVQNLQPYPYFSKACDPEIFQMMKMMWRGDPSLLQD